MTVEKDECPHCYRPHRNHHALCPVVVDPPEGWQAQAALEAKPATTQGMAIDEKAFEIAREIGLAKGMNIKDLERAIEAYERAKQPTDAHCPACNGNDGDMPCAYPGEHERQPGCLRSKRLSVGPTDSQRPDHDRLWLNVGNAIENTITYYKAEVGGCMANLYDVTDAVMREVLAAMPKAQMVAPTDDRPQRERWNIELSPDGKELLVCENDHERHEACQYERWVPVQAELTEEDKAEAVEVLKKGWGKEYSNAKPGKFKPDKAWSAALLERFTLVRKP